MTEALLLSSTALDICTYFAVLVSHFSICFYYLLRLCWLIFTIFHGFGEWLVYLCLYVF